MHSKVIKTKKNMKNLLLTTMVLFALNANAQQIELTASGAYEVKKVIEVPNSTGAQLYGRAMETLSDWTGPDGNAKANIDYHDKEAGTVIYKGAYDLGFKNVFLGEGWKRYGEFTLKIRCKDGKAQITMSTPTMLFYYTKNGMQRRWTVKEVVDEVNNCKGKRRERGEAILANMVSYTSSVIDAMAIRLSQAQVDDDDF